MKNKILSTKLLPDQIALFYLGQVGFIIKFREKYIMIDGYLSDYVDKNCGSEDVKWVRKYPQPIEPDELDFIDYIFCTHLHYDHTDPYTLSTVSRINKKAKVFASSAVFGSIYEYGFEKERVIGLDTDKEYEIENDISVTAIPSAHEEIHTDENGNALEVGFILNLGGKKVYHSGDCCAYDGLCKRLTDVSIGIMPINGRDYFRRYEQDIIGCFDSRETLTVAKKANIDTVIPVHFDLYDINKVSPAQFVDTLIEINPNQKFHIFVPGERFLY